MSGGVLLAGALAPLGLAIAMVVLALLPARSGPRGVGGALAAIEQRYARHALPHAPEEPTRSPRCRMDTRAGGPAVPVGHQQYVAAQTGPRGRPGTLDAGPDPRGQRARPPGAGRARRPVRAAQPGHSRPVRRPRRRDRIFLPACCSYNAGIKRQARIQALLPDALDMLTVCVEAGLGFDAALSQVARNTTGPLAAEFARALQEMQIGTSRPRRCARWSTARPSRSCERSSRPWSRRASSASAWSRSCASRPSRCGSADGSGPRRRRRKSRSRSFFR